MSIHKFPDFLKFLNSALMDSDPEQDESTTVQYCNSLSSDAKDRLRTEVQSMIQAGDLPLDEIGAESNRWFGSEAEAQAWMQLLLKGVSSEGAASDSDLVVKDSNGAVLLEGDSVTVIKDLKVKGGSSDLKRGTLVKKIRLTSDPELIECRVDGSTLVLRTEFLKKSL